MSALAFALAVAVSTTAAPPEASDAAKIEFLDRSLEDDARSSRLWYGGWSAFYTGATGYGVAVALRAEDDDRRLVGRIDAMRSGLGLVTTVLFVPRSLVRPTGLAPNDVVAREQWLESAAAAEERGRSWLVHVGGAAVNLGAGLYLWLHEKQLLSGLVAFVGGTLISEIKIWTQPTTAITALRDYRAGIGGRPKEQAKPRLDVAPLLSTTSAGVALTASF